MAPSGGAVDDCFAESYGEAREKFLRAAASAGAAVETHDHPRTGPAGESLHVDIARLGPPDAKRLLLSFSATHGVEGFCGSGCQVGWLAAGRGATLPAGVGVWLVHAINPHGFAWSRRVTEDNVDLNRNFVDFSGPLPENPGWRELARAICPERWDAASETVYRAACRDFIDRHGERAFVRAVTGGQYEHPWGVFYGGAQPVWSHRLLHRLARDGLGGVERLAVVDLHTGLGPFGYGELICRHPPESEALRLARRWYGDSVTSPARGESASPVATGNLRMAFVDWLPEASVVAVGLEFGTHPEDKVFEALRADNWLYLHGDPGSRAGRAIRARMREMFYPAGAEWRALVRARALEAHDQALRGLA